MGLVEKNEAWYLLGGTNGVRRTYRVERIVKAAVTDEAAERPADFDLAEAWETVVQEVNHQRERAVAVVVVDRAIVSWLRTTFGHQSVTVIYPVDSGDLPPDDDAQVRLRVTAPTELMLARGLAGWGLQVDVLEPKSVRDELIRIGTELVERYQ